MAGFTEEQKQTAIQNIEAYFRDRGNTLIHPVVLDDGNEVRGAENIFNVLSEGKRVRIPGEGNAAPDILRMNKNGRLHTLDTKAQADLVRRVDDRYRNIRQNEMPKGIDQDGNLIVHRADYSKVSQAKDLVSDWKKLKTFYEKNIENIENVKKKGKPNPPTRPKKPSLGFLNSIAYGFVWFFTAGHGDTEAHRQYRQQLDNYPNVLAHFAETTEKIYINDKKKWDEYVENGETRLAEYKEGLKRATEKYAEVSAAYTDAKNVYTDALKGNDVGDVTTYRGKLEVELEGVADLQKEGRITRNNIFAHTWLKEAENREPMGLDEMLTAVNAKKKELENQAKAESQGPQMSKS